MISKRTTDNRGRNAQCIYTVIISYNPINYIVTIVCEIVLFCIFSTLLYLACILFKLFQSRAFFMLQTCFIKFLISISQNKKVQQKRNSSNVCPRFYKRLVINRAILASTTGTLYLQKPDKNFRLYQPG